MTITASFYDWLIAYLDDADPEGIVYDDNRGTAEYRSEAGEMLRCLTTAGTAEEFCTATYQIFASYFGDSLEGSAQSYRRLARDVFHKWHETR